MAPYNGGNRLSYEKYLQHKEYFDDDLIYLLESAKDREDKLKALLDIAKANMAKANAIIKKLNFKIRDLKIISFNDNVRFTDSEEEFEKYKKEKNKEIEKINKIVNNELVHSYTINEKQKDLIIEKDKRIKELEDELKKRDEEIEKARKSSNMNSTNSSMPPSTDELKKKTVSTRQKSKRSVGGQKGHILNKSKLDNNPNDVIPIHVVKAPTGAVKGIDSKGKEYFAVQEKNLKIETIITEFRYYIKSDGIVLSEDTMRKYSVNPVTYHESFKSLVLYLHSKGVIALDRLTTMLNIMSDDKINLSNGTVTNWLYEFDLKAKPTIENLLKLLLASGNLHVDESGWKLNGEGTWLHVLASEAIALYFHTLKRNGLDGGPISQLYGYTGYLHHDHFRSYYKHLGFCIHVECNVHILRYLQAGIDNYESIACASLKNHFLIMLREVKDLKAQGHTQMSEERIQQHTEKYFRIIDKELDEFKKSNPNIKAMYKPDYINTFKRLKEYAYNHLMFINDFNVSFDNNHAERLIRPAKLKKKVCGQSKSEKGAQAFTTLFSIVQTANLQDKNPLKAIESIFNNEVIFQ